MPKVVEHSFNWCRLCRTCLTCKRFPRNVFQTGSCKCVQRHITHRAKDVKKNWTTDFRFRHLKRGEVLGLIHLSQQIEGFSHPIEPELTRANLCGTCQQRLRRAVDATKEPIKDSSSSTALSADFRKHRSIRETIRKHNMANIAFSPPALEDRACSYSPDNIWPFDSQGFTNGEASKRCSSHEVLIDHAETSSAPPVVETQRRLSSPPVLQQQNDEAARYANERIVYPGNKRCCSSETATFALNESATRKCRIMNVTFYDAKNHLLFTERAVSTMTIQELMYSYYPHAPKKLLFRESRTRMLVSASLPLANMAFDSDNISVIAHLPLLVNQGNWDLGSQSTSYRFSRDRVYTGIHAEASQPAKAHPVERAEGYHTSFHSAGSSNNACFKRRLSFGSSAAPTPNVSTDSYHSGNCFDANGSSSQDLPQLNFEKALLFREDNQSKETLDRRRDISVQSLSGLYSSSDSREDNKASAPNGCIDQSCNYSSQRLQ